jgi:hypothetical protein
MKRALLILGLTTAIAAFATNSFAGSWRLQYKLAPGQRWLVTVLSQSETTCMGTKDVNRTKTIIEYQVTKGPKPGWVSLVARIRSHTNEAGEDTAGQTGLTRITYKADMHSSGELRNIHHEGASLPSDSTTEDLTPEMKAMMQQSATLIADIWKDAVFWFPELPEARLGLGDEFDVVKKMGAGGTGAGLQTESITKQVFTLEDVSKGLAYFAVKERSITKMKGAMGGKADTKGLGKSEAVFDLTEGMWIEFVTKGRYEVKFGAGSPLGQGASEVLDVTKYEIEKQ